MADVGPSGDVKPNAFGLDMSHGRNIAVAACWIEGDSAHLELVWAGVDPAAAVEWITEHCGRRIPVVVDAMSPAASMAQDLKARRCSVTVTSAANMAQACGALENRIATETLTHAAQQEVTDAILSARRRPIRDAGGWALDRSDPASQIHPIVAATLALFGASSARRPTTGERISTRRGAVLL
jgi:hypothetical protein